MMETKPRYLLANPSIALRLQQLAEQDPNYLSHEYFNHYWQPVSFSAIKPVLAGVKLELPVRPPTPIMLPRSISRPNTWLSWRRFRMPLSARTPPIFC